MTGTEDWTFMIHFDFNPPRHFRASHGSLGLLWSTVFVLFFLLAAGCSSQSSRNRGVDFSQFPTYKPAAPFLKMQDRLQAYEPPGPQPYPYTDRNRVIYAKLSRAITRAKGEVAYRTRIRAGLRRTVKNADVDAWYAYRERQASLELEYALRERSEIRSSERRMGRRFSNYQRRVEDLRREREAEESIFEMQRREDLRNSRIPGSNLEGNAKLLEAQENAR